MRATHNLCNEATVLDARVPRTLERETWRVDGGTISNWFRHQNGVAGGS